MNIDDLQPGVIVRGPVLPEPASVVTVTPIGGVLKLARLAWEPVVRVAHYHVGSEKIIAGGESWQQPFPSVFLFAVALS